MSIQTRGKEIVWIPLKAIKRPIPPVLDHCKIDSMVSTLNGVPKASKTCKVEDITPGLLPPIDVLCVRDKGVDKYFSFGGCHRFQAYEKNGSKQVRCRVITCPKSTLRVYLGASINNFFDD